MGADKLMEVTKTKNDDGSVTWCTVDRQGREWSIAVPVKMGRQTLEIRNPTLGGGVEIITLTDDPGNIDRIIAELPHATPQRLIDLISGCPARG